MAQKTWATNDVLTASDLNTYASHEGGAWTAHTPQIDQGASTNIAKTVNYSNYARAGRLITWQFTLTLTASGTAATAVSLTLPATAASVSGLTGGGSIYDTSTTTRYAGAWSGLSTTTIVLQGDWSGVAAGWGATPNLALASGDVISGVIVYEAAS